MDLRHTSLQFSFAFSPVPVLSESSLCVPGSIFHIYFLEKVNSVLKCTIYNILRPYRRLNLSDMCLS